MILHVVKNLEITTIGRFKEQTQRLMTKLTELDVQGRMILDEAEVCFEEVPKRSQNLPVDENQLEEVNEILKVAGEAYMAFKDDDNVIIRFIKTDRGIQIQIGAGPQGREPTSFIAVKDFEIFDAATLMKDDDEVEDIICGAILAAVAAAQGSTAMSGVALFMSASTAGGTAAAAVSSSLAAARAAKQIKDVADEIEDQIEDDEEEDDEDEEKEKSTEMSQVTSTVIPETTTANITTTTVLSTTEEEEEETTTEETTTEECTTTEEPASCPLLTCPIPDPLGDGYIEMLQKDQRLMQKRQGGLRLKREDDEDTGFDPSWIELIEKELFEVLDHCLLLKDDVQRWFRFRYNTNDKFKSQFACLTCKKYRDMLPGNYKISGSDWYTLNSKRYLNDNRVETHANSPSHKLSTLLEQQDKNEEVRRRVFREGRISNSLINMLATVYTEGRMGLSFIQHPRMVNLEKYTETNIGRSMSSAWSAVKMHEFISDKMHTKLIENIKKSDAPVAWILDGSTNKAKDHMFSVSFMTLDDEDYPVTWFWRIIDVTQDQSARGMMSKVSQYLEEDNLVSVMKSRLISIAADGASAMQGGDGSFDKIIKTALGKPNIETVWCACHRIDLVVLHALKKDDKGEDTLLKRAVREMEQFINNIYTIYQRSGPRREHFKISAKKIGVNIPNSFTYINQVRWVATEVKAVQRFLEGWFVLALDLKVVSEDKKWSADVRKRAEEMRSTIIDRKFFLMTHYFLDILLKFEDYSLKFQGREHVLIDALPFRDDMMSFIERIRLHDGETILPNFIKILRSVICDTKQCNTFHKYFDADIALYHGIKLVKSDTFTKLSFIEFRSQVTEQLRKEMSNYFPTNEFHLLKIFNPHKLPTKRNEAYGITEIHMLVEKYHLGSESETSVEWIDMVDEIANHTDRCKYLNTEPHTFWSFYSSLYQEQFPRMRSLLRIILSIPVGTALAERSFSIMNNIMDSKRTLLAPRHLDDLMRVAINGDDNLEIIPFEDWAKEWQKKYKSTPDQLPSKGEITRRIVNKNLFLD